MKFRWMVIAGAEATGARYYGPFEEAQEAGEFVKKSIGTLVWPVSIRLMRDPDEQLKEWSLSF